MTLTTERQQFAEQNEMSLEFVNWFFDEKKESFGNMWFLMAAALWEGWKGRDDREAQPVGYAENGKGFIYPPERRDRIQNPVAVYTSPPATANAVAWEMRYWNSGHNCWHDWERITAEQHAEMSVQHAADNDYEFRVLYDAPPAPAVPEKCPEHVRSLMNIHADDLFDDADAQEIWNACRAAMLAQPVSSGYKLVPVEPTENMIIDGFESDAFMALADAVNEKNGWPYGCKESAECVEGIFKAMLSAAPEKN